MGKQVRKRDRVRAIEKRRQEDRQEWFAESRRRSPKFREQTPQWTSTHASQGIPSLAGDGGNK